MFAVNVAAPIEVTNAFLPLLAKSDRPSVVHVSSARGSISFAESLPAERTGALVYNASKASLSASDVSVCAVDAPDMITVIQSKQLVSIIPNLRVNAACPGHCRTKARLASIAPLTISVQPLHWPARS